MRFIRQGTLHSDLYAASGIPCRCHRWGLADSFKRSVSAANVRSGAPLGGIVVNNEDRIRRQEMCQRLPACPRWRPRRKNCDLKVVDELAAPDMLLQFSLQVDCPVACDDTRSARVVNDGRHSGRSLRFQIVHSDSCFQVQIPCRSEFGSDEAKVPRLH